MTDSPFVAAIVRNWPDYTVAAGAAPGFDCCGDHSAESDALAAADEGGFSYSPCDSCGSTFGGDRYPAHAIHLETFGPDAKRPGDVHHIEICVDCLMFHANGDEPETWDVSP